MARQVSSGRISEEERQAALGKIVGCEKPADLSDVDLVIESASENEEIKREIFRSLCVTLKPEALLATNTSSISITRLAASTDRPERFIGIHFMGEAADLVDGAIADVLAEGVRTADLATEGQNTVSTREMGDAILAALSKRAG